MDMDLSNVWESVARERVKSCYTMIYKFLWSFLVAESYLPIQSSIRVLVSDTLPKLR